MVNSSSNSNQKWHSSQLVFSPAAIRDVMKNSSNKNNNNNRNCHHNHHLHIPDDVILEILLRLRVKSLIRFKSVCKSWLSLISNPHFVESHFNQASHRLLCIVPSLSSCFKAYSIDIDASLHHHSTIQLPKIINNQRLSSYKFQASCRGFVLLDNNSSLNFFLWNPSSGSHTTLPYPPIVDSDERWDWQVTSLGYDVATDDYLVLMKCISFGISNTTFCMKFFSVRKNSWEETSSYETCVDLSTPCTSGLFFNGAIYWLLNDIAILCFDLRLKKFSEIDVPAAFCPPLGAAHLMVLGGYLGMYNCHEIWVMKEHKVHSSWTKYSDLYNDEVSVVHVNKAGEMIGLRDRTFQHSIALVIKLDDKGEELESREFCDQSFIVKHLYKESLFSLPEK